MDEIVTFEKIVFDRLMMDDKVTVALLFTDTSELDKYCNILKNQFHAKYDKYDLTKNPIRMVIAAINRPYFAVIHSNCLLLNYVQVGRDNKFLHVNDVYGDPKEFKFI